MCNEKIYTIGNNNKIVRVDFFHIYHKEVNKAEHQIHFFSYVNLFSDIPSNDNAFLYALDLLLIE